MNAPVREHVLASVPRLPRGAQLVRVVAVGEDRSAPAHDAVQGAGHANLQALHGARERQLVGRLDDEVDVVPLNGEVNEPEAEPGTPPFESAPQLTKATMRAKVPHFLPHARGDVQRAAAETRTRSMSDVASRALALPPCTFSRAAPERKRKLLLFCDHARSVRAGSDIEAVSDVSGLECQRCPQTAPGWRSKIRCPPFQVTSGYDRESRGFLAVPGARASGSSRESRRHLKGRTSERRRALLVSAFSNHPGRAAQTSFLRPPNQTEAEPAPLERADIRPGERRSPAATSPLRRSAALPRPPARRPRTPRGSAAWQAPGRPG